MDNDRNARNNLKNMFIYVRRDGKFSEKSENTPLLGFSDTKMVFGNTKVLKSNDAHSISGESGKKFLVLNGKKFQIVQHRDVVKVPRIPTTSTSNSPEGNSKMLEFQEKTQQLANGSKKIVLTPIQFMKNCPKVHKEVQKKSIGIQSVYPPKFWRFDRGTSMPVLKKFDRNTQTYFEIEDKTRDSEKKEIAVQTEESFDLLFDFLNRYLNEEDSNDLITGNDLNLNQGVLSNEGGAKIEKKIVDEKDWENKRRFHDDLISCLNWDSGNLPIHKAVIEKNIPMLKRQNVVLKIRQHDVNIRNHQNLTPLHLAILEDADLQTVAVLLNNGALASLRDADGNNALHLAVMKNRFDLVEILMTSGAAATLDVDCYNHEGLTPLMLCAFENDRIDVAEKLLKKGAQPNLKDLKSGRTALFHAAEKHNTPMVSLLLDYSADTKIRNFFGTSVHDAMFELDDIPKEIKYPILGRDMKVHQKRKLNLQESSASSSLLSNMAAMVMGSPSGLDLMKRKKLEIVPTFQKIEKNTKFVVHNKKNS